MRPAKKYNKEYLEKIVKESKSFRDFGKRIGVEGKTAKAIALRYKINYCHFKHNNAYEHMVGRKYNMLTILDICRIKPKDKRVRVIAKCLCDCGKEKEIFASSVKAKRTGSCGCDKSRYDKTRGKKSKLYTGYEGISGTFFSRLKRKSKERKIYFDLDVKYLWDLFIKQDEKCALSDIPIKFGRDSYRTETTASLDRIDSSKGYIKNNIQWVHKSVNIMKNDLSEDIFIGICDGISNKFRNIKKVDIKILSENHFTKRGDKWRTS